MRAILLAVALAALAQPALAQPFTSIDTELVKGRCRFIADDGEVGHYALKRCPGLAGARVYTEAGVNSVKLSFKWGRRKVEAVSSGSKLEWRGIKTRQGFKPHAIILTIVVKDYPAETRHNVLGVIRMEPRNACLMAVIDEAANADALPLARKTADAEAPSFSCASGKAKAFGVATKWTQEALSATTATRRNNPSPYSCDRQRHAPIDYSASKPLPIPPESVLICRQGSGRIAFDSGAAGRSERRLGRDEEEKQEASPATGSFGKPVVGSQSPPIAHPAGISLDLSRLGTNRGEMQTQQTSENSFILV